MDDILVYNGLKTSVNRPGRIKSAGNSLSATTTILSAATWTGTAEISTYTGLTFSGKTNGTATLYLEFSHDGVIWDSSLPYSIDGVFNEVHRLVNTKTYFRVRIVNTAGVDIDIRMEVFYGDFGLLSSPLNTSVSEDADSITTRSVLMGQHSSGKYNYVPISAEGHLEVEVHGPRLPFGSIHTEKLTPVFQSDAVYLIDPNQENITVSGTGTAGVEDSSFKVSSGATIYSQAVIQSRKRLRYRAGQGVVGRFAGLFTAPVANSYQLVGYGHAEDGVYFGYADTLGVVPEFGILYVNRGKREVKTLTVTVGATGAGTAVVTLNGTPFNVAISGAFSTTGTAWQIAQGTFTGWDAYASGATVVFVKASAGVTAGTQSFAAGASGISATIAQTRAGVASTDLFIPQSTWNGDRVDGSNSVNNPSGFDLDPTKGNVFQIGIQYLGYGAITFEMEVTSNDGNNADFVVLHTIKAPNTRILTTFGNPSFPFTMAAYSAGSTTDLVIKVGSYAGFIEGSKTLHGPRQAYYGQQATIADSVFRCLFTVKNKLTYAGVINQAVVNLLSVSAATKHTNPVTFYLIRNGILAGNPNFVDKAANSCCSWDTAATTITFTLDESLIWTGQLGDTGNLDHHFGNGEFNAEEVTLQPGEWVTLATKSVSGNAQFSTGSLNTREDQ